MDIEHIRTFLEIAATGSFQMTGEKLNLTQSTISIRLKTLEEALNQKLIIRKRNGSELTSGGYQFLNYAKTIIQNWDQAYQETSLSKDFQSIINFGVQLNHWESAAIPWIAWMEENSPNMATKVISDYTDPLVALLRKGLLDLAIIYTPQQRPELKTETFDSENLILISSTPRNVASSQMPGYIFVDWGEKFRHFHSLAFPKIQFSRLSVALSVVGLNHILKFGGSGYFLESSVKDYIEENKLFIVEKAPVFELTTYLAYHSQPINRKKIAKAVEGLKSIKNR